MAGPEKAVEECFHFSQVTPLPTNCMSISTCTSVLKLLFFTHLPPLMPSWESKNSVVFHQLCDGEQEAACVSPDCTSRFLPRFSNKAITVLAFRSLEHPYRQACPLLGPRHPCLSHLLARLRPLCHRCLRLCVACHNLLLLLRPRVHYTLPLLFQIFQIPVPLIFQCVQ